MRILHISDSHNLHRQLANLPPADIIIHSGDVSMAGTGNEVVDFINWFGGLEYKYKIFIAGNHDYCLDGKRQEMIRNFLPPNCYYLCNSGITIEGINFWGTPFFFRHDESGRYQEMITQIPNETDILITHRPPLGILDTVNNIRFGCPDLLQVVQRICPRYHLFGHIHDVYGIMESEKTTFINAALMDEKYRLVNNPIVFDI